MNIKDNTDKKEEEYIPGQKKNSNKNEDKQFSGISGINAGRTIYDIYKKEMNEENCKNNSNSEKSNFNNIEFTGNNSQLYYNLRGCNNMNKTCFNNNQNYFFSNEILLNNKYCKSNEDKITFLKHLIAKNLDRLNDDDMFGLIEYIEEIRPEAILEKPGDDVEIDTTKFIEDTYLKLYYYFSEIIKKKYDLKMK